MPPTISGTAIVRVSCDQGVVAQGTLYLSISRQQAHLVAQNASLTASMLRGQSHTVEFQILNDGAAPTGPITLLCRRRRGCQPARPDAVLH